MEIIHDIHKSHVRSSGFISRESGFTLLELLVSIVIISIVSVLIVQTFFTTVKTNTKAEALRDTKQHGDYALEVITRMIRNARSIESACSEGGTVLGSLVLRSRDNYVSTLTCSATEGITRVASVSAETEVVEYLTGTNVTLGSTDCGASNLTFTCNSYRGVPASVDVSFSLYQQAPEAEAALRSRTDFNTTITLRN